jgi:hypothetical protein
MRFIVRYWSSLLPKEYRKADGSPRLVDYSIHPPTRIGLHNAMLSHNDRLEILEAHGGQYQCEVYVVEGVHAHVLTREMAVDLFNALPHGEVKWTTIREFLLPKKNEDKVEQRAFTREVSHERQLHLFESGHAPYDDTVTIHHLDIDA